MLKRFAYLGIISILVTILAPIALALPANSSLVNVTFVTPFFNPSKDEKANIQYSVDGPGSATGLTVKIYNSQCTSSIQTIDGPSTKAVGTYTTPWTGKAGGNPLSAGLYCYKLTWGNAPTGASNVKQGYITLTNADLGGQSGGSGNQGGTGGQSSGGTGGFVDSTLPIISASVDKSTIDPTKNENANISYTVNQNLSSGFTFNIYDSGGFPVKQYSTSNSVAKGTAGTFTWNGRFPNLNPVPVGIYYYKFKVSNQEVAGGAINVSYTAIITPTGAQVADITHYVTPTTFDPSKGPDLNICYTVKQTLATGVDLTLVIKNPSGTIIFSKTKTAVAQGSDCEPWNGLVNGIPVNAGTYQYVFYSAGQLIGSGTFYVTIAPPAQPAPVITDLGPNLSTFNPYTQTTTFSYQLTQDAKVHFAIKDSTGTIVRHLQMKGTTNNGFANGTNSIPWDGKNETPAVLADGTYTYLIEAENANGQAQSKTGPITISTFGITDLSADPNPFNPEFQSTNLKFTLNQNAYVTVTVSNASNNAFVKTVVSNQFYGAGSQFVPWNGTDSTNTWVLTGIYNFKVDASLTPGGPVNYSATGNVQVNRTVVTQNILDVSNIFANPNPFNPDIQNTLLTFSLNQGANITITVSNTLNNAFVKTVVSNQFYNAGTNLTATWTGAYASELGGYLVPDGTYNFKVDATYPGYTSDSAVNSVTVSRTTTTSNLQITDYGANPTTFNPGTGQTTKIDFSVNMAPSSVNVQIYKLLDNSFVRELPLSTIGTNYYRAEWNGRNYGNNIVSDGTYMYRINVTAPGKTAMKENYVVVTSGTVGQCGNFPDVSKTDELCPAIEFVKLKGIFNGYADGTLGLDNVIQRADFLTVVQKAFKFPLTSYIASIDGDLGYKDLKKKTSKWYMPYLKTFRNLELMVGYPDGKMRPEQTMGTAELYLVFLKSGKNAPTNMAHYVVQDNIKFAPYLDTPIEKNTKWYMKYAFFAKLNDLVSGKYFHPEKGITRKQVIKLIYDTHLKGLITY